ncbi:hypothetical protein D1871_10435 [Nakamurella silvestris]|nr:hypothetical protein D1871_10435 [Nakamurella silvestris]
MTFAPMIGLPCWLVRRGHGSFVTLEFGSPQLTIAAERASDQLWMFFQPSGEVLSVRGEGKYSLQPGNIESRPGSAESESHWHRLPAAD